VRPGKRETEKQDTHRHHTTHTLDRAPTPNVADTRASTPEMAEKAAAIPQRVRGRTSAFVKTKGDEMTSTIAL